MQALSLSGTLGRGEYPQHTYTYLLCDLLTDELLAELPLSGVKYATELNGIGALSAFVPYNDETLPLDPENATVPGGCRSLYVDRDGVIVWGGIVWTRDLAKGGKQIQGAEFFSYFQHRYVRSTLATDTSLLIDQDYVPDGQRLYADQRYLVWSLLRYAAVQPSGDIHIDLNPLVNDGATGISRTASYFGYERPEVYKAIADLAASDDGFDFGIEVGWTPVANNVAPTRYKRARVWYPQRGRTASQSGLVFSKGGPAGNILDFSWPENGTAFATDTSALGAGEGEAKVISTAQSADLLASGWPLLENVSTYTDVIDAAQLQGLANSDLAAASKAGVAPWFDVTADDDPAFGSYSVGDSGLFVIDPEPRMPFGLEAELRIVSIENTANRGPETVRLTCAAV